jgi:hypothetical protein
MDGARTLPYGAKNDALSLINDGEKGLFFRLDHGG